MEKRRRSWCSRLRTSNNWRRSLAQSPMWTAWCRWNESSTRAAQRLERAPRSVVRAPHFCGPRGAGRGERLSRRFLDLARADAARADVHPAHSFPDAHANALKIWQPAPAGNVVGMADAVSEYRCFSSDFAGLGDIYVLN